ncbi:replication initiator [Phycicoccus sp. M110.8]|nr:replication initiator [Phycicoccus sp. M110.8]MDU0313175.1 replication initiator [Phycicoccus sp. M110.8]
MPVLLADLRRGHVPSHPRRGSRRQRCPRHDQREPVGVRHPDSALVRARPRHPRQPPPLPPTRQKPALPPRSPHDLHGRPRRRGPAAGAAPVLGVLRLRLPRRVAVVGPGAMATLHHRATPRTGPAPQHPRDQAQYPGVAAVRQGRGVPARGLIHFHALIRLDGPKVDGAFGPAPVDVDADQLADLIRDAAASVRFTAAPVSDGDVERVLAFGAQVDARHVRTGHRTDDPGQHLAPEQVAGYLAKYSTKSATDTTDHGNAHLRRIKTVVDEFARAVEDQWNHAGRPVELRDWPYGLLGKWVHDLGFRGHFASKSRRYSVTLGQLRRARRRAQVLLADAQRRGDPIDLASMEAQLLADDDAEATLIVGSWSFAGIGWDTPGDVALAKAAAARAREHAQYKAKRKTGTSK